MQKGQKCRINKSIVIWSALRKLERKTSLPHQGANESDIHSLTAAGTGPGALTGLRDGGVNYRFFFSYDQKNPNLFLS